MQTDRSLGIGGSEAAAACGLDPFRSQVELWLEKTGRVPPRDESEAMRWGTILEPILLGELGRRTQGVYSILPPGNVPLKPLAPFMVTGGIDGLALEQTNGNASRATSTTGVVECKTTSGYMAHHWADEKVPDAYVIQAMHYLALTGLSFAIVCVLIGGQRFEWRRLERDDKLIGQMIELEGRFWEHVTSDTPPAPDGSESAERMCNLLYPHGNGAGVSLSPEDGRHIRAIRKLKRALKATEAQLAKHEQALKLRLGEAETGLLEGVPVVRWTNVISHRVDTSALKAMRPEVAEEFTVESTSRRFLVK